jgi:RNA polymerase sigma-70 factor (ECF subfamily)
VSVPPPTSRTGWTRGIAFQHTLWSQVLAAGRLDDADSTQALESLCHLYWYPIYAFLRRWGYERQNARDFTQGFFTHLLEDNVLRKADPEKGRFRSFLLGSLRMFLSNEEAKERALKRGGGLEIVSIDAEAAEGRYRFDPATHLSPEKLFDRRWALEVIAEAMRRLEGEYRRVGSADLFAALQPYLVGDQNGSIGPLAAKLNKTEGATRVVVCRLRNRFRKLIRGVIAHTLSDPAQVEGELQDLQAVLRESGR